MIEDYKYSNYRSLYYTIIDHYRSILAVIVTIYDLVTSSDYITITMIVTYVYIFLVTIGSYHCYSYIVLSICHIYILIMSQSYIGTIYSWLRSGPGGTSAVGLGPEGDPGRCATMGFFTKG